MEEIRQKPKEELNYHTSSDDLARLFEATANLLERKWDKRHKNVDSARTIFFQSVRIAINTFHLEIWRRSADELCVRMRKIMSKPCSVRLNLRQPTAQRFSSTTNYLPKLPNNARRLRYSG